MTPDHAVIADRPPSPTVAAQPGPSWLSLRAGDRWVSIGRAFAREIAADADHDADTIALLASELLTNAIRAARDYAEAGFVPAWSYLDRPVKIGVLVTARWARVDVTDPDPRKLAPTIPADPLPEKGRGLGIVDLLSAGIWVTYEATSKTVHVVIAKPGVTLTAAELEQIGAPA